MWCCWHHTLPIIMQYVTFTHAPILRASTTVGVRSKAQSPRARSSHSQWVGVCAFAPKTEGRFAWGKGKRTNLVCARGGFGNILHLHYCTLRGLLSWRGGSECFREMLRASGPNNETLHTVASLTLSFWAAS